MSAKIRVELTRPQLDALIGACVLADSYDVDARQDNDEFGASARAEKRVRDRAFAALVRAKRGTR